MSESVPRVRLRAVLVLLAIAFVFTQEVLRAISPVWYEDLSNPLPPALIGFLLYAVTFAGLVWLARRGGIGWRRLLGPAPDHEHLRWTLACGVALVGFSMFSLYLVFLPLSFSHPEFVRSWLLEDPYVVIWTEGESFQLANGINFAVIVLLGPMTEEFLFRGLLLPMSAARWGETKAVVGSSALFAAFHLDLIGAFVFSVVASALYLRVRSLSLPILLHVASNALVWLFVLGWLPVHGPEEQTLREFQSFWWVGAVGLVVGAPLLVASLRSLPGSRPAIACPR